MVWFGFWGWGGVVWAVFVLCVLGGCCVEGFGFVLVLLFDVGVCCSCLDCL